MRFSGEGAGCLLPRRRLVRRLFALVVVAVFAAGPSRAIAAAPDEVGSWGPVQRLGVAGIHAALMHTGKVLLWSSGPNAIVFDPVNGDVKQAPTLFNDSNVHCAGLVVLADGRVLVVGGERITTSATFDPITEQWTKGPDMHFIRWYPSVTMLGDGRVLVAGGREGDQSQQGTDVTQPETYDPRSNTWTLLTGAEHRQDVYAPDYLLPDGDIFQPGPWQSALLDLNTLAWSAGPDNHWQTSGYSESGAIYGPGKIIRSGGTVTVGGAKQASARTEIIDMTQPAPAFEEVARMAFPRRRHNMVLLADGSTMAVGGTYGLGDDPAQAILPGEIWNPATKRWTTVASMSVPRMYHSTALLLPDGRVLAAGGEETDVGADSATTAQIYSPPYLFHGDRPAIDAAPRTIAYRGAFTIVTRDAQSITSVALIRPSAVTHAYNMDQRYVPLSFTRSANGVTATAPQDGNTAPPGWYMLVIKNGGGVPSVAKWVQVGTGPTSGLEAGPGAAGSRSPAQGSGGPAGPDTAAAGAVGGSSSSAFVPSSEAQDDAAAPRLPKILGLSARRRVRATEVRQRGVSTSVKIAGWDDPDGRVLRVRLLRVEHGTPRRVAATSQRVWEPDVYRFKLRSATLRPGRYAIEAAIVGAAQHVDDITTRSVVIVG